MAEPGLCALLCVEAEEDLPRHKVVHCCRWSLCLWSGHNNVQEIWLGLYDRFKGRQYAQCMERGTCIDENQS